MITKTVKLYTVVALTVQVRLDDEQLIADGFDVDDTAIEEAAEVAEQWGFDAGGDRLLGLGGDAPLVNLAVDPAWDHNADEVTVDGVTIAEIARAKRITRQ